MKRVYTLVGQIAPIQEIFWGKAKDKKSGGISDAHVKMARRRGIKLPSKLR